MTRPREMPAPAQPEIPISEPDQAGPARSTWPPLLAAALAGFSLPVYFFYAFVIPQTPGRLARASAALIAELPIWRAIISLPLPIPQDSNVVAVLLVLFAVAAFAAYGAALYLTWNHRGNAALSLVVLIAAFAFFLISFWSLPNSNTDIYNYMMRGRTMAVYHDNPYYVAADYPGDPIYPYASHNYTGEPGDRPPAWTLINVFLAWIAGDSPVTNLFVYRFALSGFNVANVVLIAMILRRLKSRRVLASIVLYAWNPIVVLFGSNKTDTVMVFFLLAAILLLVMERKNMAVVFMGLSVLVKLITLPFVALYLLRHLRLKQWRQLAADSALLGLTALALYLPFLEDPRMLLGLVDLLGLGGAGAGGSAFVGAALKGLFVLAFLAVGLRASGGKQQLLWQGAVVLLVFSILLTRISLSWYLLTLIALVGVVLEWRLAVMTVVLSFSSFLVNTWQSTFGGGFSAPAIPDVPRFVIYVGLAAVVAGAIWWRDSLREAISEGQVHRFLNQAAQLEK